MYLTGITAGIILEIVAGYWNVWTMCAAGRVDSWSSLASPHLPICAIPSRGMLSFARAQRITGMLAAGPHDRLCDDRIILVLFYMERKYYMIKLGACLSQPLADGSFCVCASFTSGHPPASRWDVKLTRPDLSTS